MLALRMEITFAKVVQFVCQFCSLEGYADESIPQFSLALRPMPQSSFRVPGSKNNEMVDLDKLKYEDPFRLGICRT